MTHLDLLKLALFFFYTLSQFSSFLSVCSEVVGTSLPDT